MATKTKKEYMEGDYVPGKGILNPYGGYYPTAAEKKTSSSPGAYKGVAIQPGSDSYIASQIQAIDAKSASGGNISNNTSGAPTGKLANNTTNVPIRNEEVAILQGDYGQDAQSDLYNKTVKSGAIREPALDARGSAAMASQYGLLGIADKDFVGLTASQATKKAQEIKKSKLAQTSTLTSGAFNPQTISGFGNKFKELKFKVDEINNDPWTNKKEKKNKNEALVKSYTDQFAGLFGSQDEFNNALQNPDFQKTLKQYEQIGGTMSDIASGIGRSPTLDIVSETPNPDGSYNVKYSDGTSENRRYSQNADGTYTSNPAQTLDEYLGNIDSPAEQKALDSLIPEKAVYQNQIAFEQSIPEQYKALYFGTPDQMGILQQRRIQAEEEVKLLERTAKNDIKNLRAQAEFAIEKNNHEMDIEESKIEENRLSAKNYMTGMLAKLGALQTTGAAPQAIATLEQKYEKQKIETRTAYNMDNKYTELQLNEKIDGVHAERDNNILKTKGDLSKSEEDVWKDVFKYQNDADRKTLDIIETYAGKFRTQKEKYVKESKAAAEKYAKEFGSIISSVDLEGFREGDYIPSLVNGKKNKNPGILIPDGSIRDIRNFLETSRDAEGYVDPKTYKEMADAFTRTGGTVTDFKKQFPPADYVNPTEKSLPLNLQYSRPSQTTPKDITEDDI